MHILNLKTFIYLQGPGDLAKSNLLIHLPTILSQMPVAEANLVIHLPTILSWMPLAEANLLIHFPAILSRMLLAEVNHVNTLDFIYIEHVFIVIAFTRRILTCISANRRKNHASTLLVS